MASSAWFGHSGFEDARERAQRLASIEQQWDPTGIQLRALNEKLIDDLISQNDAAAALADGYRWHAASRDVPGVAQRVAFTVQSLERQFVPGDENASRHWHSLLRHYIGLFWAWREFYSEVCNVASSGLAGLEDWMQGGDLKKYNRYRREFISDLPEHAYRFHPDKILRLASELADELPSGLHRKIVLEAAGWARDSAAASLHLQALERRFDVMLQRAIRIRNAVTHGGRVIPAVADSVDRFTFGLEALILGSKQWALIDSTSPVAVHQRWRVRALHARDLLRDDADFAEALTTFSGPAD